MKTNLTKPAGPRTETVTRPIETILVPTDFSGASLKAVTFAKQVARSLGARVSLLHVIEPVVLPDAAAMIALPDDQLAERMHKELQKLAQNFEDTDFQFESFLVRKGTAFHEITLAAAAEKSDLIVIATHGYTGLKHVLLGSTAERVVRHARCPVLVVPARD